VKSRRDWILLILIVALFLGANLFLIYRWGIYSLEYIPVILLFVLVLFTRLDIVFYSIALLVPLSIPLHFLKPGIEYDLSIPAEPIIVSLMMVFLAKCLTEGSYDSRLLRHRVSVAIYFYLLWMLITSFTSTHFLVSFKYFLARFWFITVFYFFGLVIFKKIKNIQRYEWLYIASLLLVIAYTFARHIPAGLTNQQASNWACQPLYNDHTDYGAALAMVLPFAIAGLFINKKTDILIRIVQFFIVVLLLVAIVFSYTRATWLSLAGAAGIWIIMKLHIRFWKIVLLAIAGGILFYSFQTEILYALQRNRSGSSGDFMQHLQSMTNISTDESNLERINRWDCALKMFEDKPWFGWGPGTYQFEYGAYQSANKITSISTFAGDLGNAHSEYLGPLAEQGIFGTVAFLLVLITSMYTGIHVYNKAGRRKVRILAMAFVVALSTYYLHGILNNFLDTDKLSALFWTNIAMLVSFDVYKKKKDE